ncbi:uncharacterized protein LOC117172129 [Belonocnema kinseyi]|uniref:uncharacterized protein LOC117172129 n=1 Tax=Belonocnema kinseyi TaxID=2817044 RepID=UPI00143D4A38|nr:uncharacterized protein LOC117172129 [Belonocnema kinseyi]
MQKIFLSLALLSTVTSEELETKKHRPLLPEDGLQFWLPRDSISWDIKDQEGRRHQESKSSLSKISESHDLTRFFFNNPNLPTNTSEDDQASNNHQSLNELSGIDKRKPAFLLPFGRFGLSKINPNQKGFKCHYDRCRRKHQDWSLQEPVYVEEPNWVQIESESLETPIGRSEPFFVNRGKRSIKLKTLNPLKNTIKGREMEEANTPKENIHESNARKKREVSPKVIKMKPIQRRSETDNKKWLESIEKSLIGGDNSAVMTKSSSYLHPRNKHSDVLEILEEPFFISRGKKNHFVPSRNFFWEEFYSDQDLDNLSSDMYEDAILSRLELDVKQKILENILNYETHKKRFQDENKNEIQSNSKRGVLEELDVQFDPFYVARG